MSKRLALFLPALAASACFFFRDATGPLADPSFGVAAVSEGAAAEFHEHASAFYTRLELRRVNAFGTYNDETLRSYFHTEQSFADYYADLAQALYAAHFEKNRPLRVEVLEFVFEAPGRARVEVRLTGNNALPLRPGTRELLRRDQWEQAEGRWWLVPGKL